MGIHMKTTLELSDVLFNDVKALALAKQTTMRALVEEDLRRVLADAKAAKSPAFKLKNGSVGGGQMLITDPRKWAEMETEAVAENVLQ